MAEEVLWGPPGEWSVGDTVRVDVNGKLWVSGRIKEVIGGGSYKIDVEEGGIQARRRAQSN
jgi:non-ribosomal peptide synthetase component E (peptide arylation enzyme)